METLVKTITRNAKLNRRDALKLSATAGFSIATAGRALASDSIKTGVHQQEPGNCSTPRTAVAKTQYGKVRGFVDGGVLTFKGVPYGANTAGESRWLPAKPLKPWDGEFPALVYGANCPQNLHTWTGNEQTFVQMFSLSMSSLCQPSSQSWMKVCSLPVQVWRFCGQFAP